MTPDNEIQFVCNLIFDPSEIGPRRSAAPKLGRGPAAASGH